MKGFHFGENLRDIRIAKRIKQEVMATKLNMAQGTYSKIESSPSIPDHKLVIEMSNALEVPVENLMPPLEVLDTTAMHSTYGAGIELKVKEMLSSKFGLLIVLAVGCVLVPASWELTRAFSIEFKASENFIVWAPRIAAAAMFWYIGYVVKKIKGKK